MRTQTHEHYKVSLLQCVHVQQLGHSGSIPSQAGLMWVDGFIKFLIIAI